MKKMTITLITQEKIEIELWDDIAPNAIKHMSEIAAKKKYDNRKIERIEPGFCIQPICEENDPEIDELIPVETCDIQYDKYIVGMGGDGNKASAGQYFICMRKASHLDNLYTIVGKVVSGFETIERLNTIKVLPKKDKVSDFIYHVPEADEIVLSVTIG